MASNGTVESRKVTASEITPAMWETMQGHMADLEARIKSLADENAMLRLAQANGDRLTFRRTSKGAVSIYGFGKWPVTLYAGQIVRFIGQIDDLKHLVYENWDKLSHKDGEVKPSWTIDQTKVTKGIILGDPKVEDEKAAEVAGKAI